MASNECIPYWDNGDTITCYAQTAVIGKRFVSVTGARQSGTVGTSAVGPQPTVNLTGAGLGSCIGVAAYDAAAGQSVTVFHEPSIILPVTAGASITAGQLVQSDATGRAIPFSAGKILGLALDTVTVGQDCAIDRSIVI